MKFVSVKEFVLKYFLALLLILNLVLKLLFLTTQNICHDEPFTIYHAQFNVQTIIQDLANYNNPPLYEILLHYWIKLFGISPFSVRLFPCLFGAISPMILFVLCKKHFDLFIAVTASLLLSFSTILTYYSHDCRVYTLLVLLAISSMYFYLEIVSSDEVKFSSILKYALASGLMCYSHYFGFIVIFVQGTHLILYCRNHIMDFLKSLSLFLIFYLPHLFILFIRFTDSVSRGTWIDPPGGIEDLYFMIWIFSNYPFITVFCIAILVFSFVKLLIGFSKQKLNTVGSLILFWFIFPYLGMFFISYKVPMYISRYLLFCLPGYYILLPLCLQFLLKNSRYRVCLAIALVLSFMYTSEINPEKKHPLKELVEAVIKIKNEKTFVQVNNRDFIHGFAYHYNLEYFKAVMDEKENNLTDSLLKSENIFCVNNLKEINFNSNIKFDKFLLLEFDRRAQVMQSFEFNFLKFKLSSEKRFGTNWRLITYDGI